MNRYPETEEMIAKWKVDEREIFPHHDETREAVSENSRRFLIALCGLKYPVVLVLF